MTGQAASPIARACGAVAKEDPLTLEFTIRGLYLCRALAASVNLSFSAALLATAARRTN